MESGKRLYEKIWDKFAPCLYFVFLILGQTISVDCFSQNGNFQMSFEQGKRFSLYNQKCRMLLDRKGIQYDSVVNIPICYADRKKVEELEKHIMSGNLVADFSSEYSSHYSDVDGDFSLLKMIDTKNVVFDLSFVYSQGQPIGIVEIDAPMWAFVYKKKYLKKGLSFKRCDSLPISNYEKVMSMVWKIGADWCFLIYNMSKTLFCVRGDSIIVLRYKDFPENEIQMLDYDYYIKNVFPDEGHLMLVWQHCIRLSY